MYMDEEIDWSKYRMYILVREQYPGSVAVNSSAHGAMNAFMNWDGEFEFDGWRKNSFKKITCLMNEVEQKNLYKVMELNGIKYFEQTEGRLNGEHILTVCYPFDATKKEFKAFKFLRLFK